MLWEPEVVSERAVRLECVGNNRAEFPYATCEVRTHERHKLIAWVGIDPDAVLQMYEARAL
ncbi:hypothetical protein A2704_06765 [Candidatus Kaiserbacteria bacterium RIFCSPHIGHO2_01_FULL_54_36b]|uniref:Uncharacterized protein n=1 Tax=Candidatus Kaiserbacteria bacterium RIFCSPHIGHO2_01_FULL_54_36b TaxID=1798483 RepID=A0A1F6CRS4_9BACT|nr:MAG: hypothetical protein A2704_06765 [Candidatus Kaiserbacteria bacterium RIFCSPHIGHO2_01_FULL_54_36b]